jgi:hypothetical protein
MTASMSGTMDQEIMKTYIDRVLVPFYGNRPFLLVMDRFRVHLTREINQKFNEVNAKLLLLPAGYTHCLQPLDVSVNKPFKDIFKDLLCQWFNNTAAIYTKGKFINSSKFNTYYLLYTFLPIIKNFS